MKLLFTLIALFWSAPAFGMIWIEPVVISVSDLQKKGFTIEAKEAPGSIPSLEISVDVSKDIDEEQYLSMQLVIVDREVSQEDVEAIDTRGRSIRSVTKEERHATFTLIGKEQKCAYLIFDFKLPDERGVPHERKYLLSIAEVLEKKTSQPLQ